MGAAPQMPQSSPSEHAWSTLGIAVLAVVLLAIGAYAWYATKDTGSQVSNEDIEQIQAQSASNDPSSIEADLGAQSPDDFDAEIDAAFEGVEGGYAE